MDCTNPYEGPEPCECGHDGGEHFTQGPCGSPRCQCSAFVMAGPETALEWESDAYDLEMERRVDRERYRWVDEGGEG